MVVSTAKSWNDNAAGMKWVAVTDGRKKAAERMTEARPALKVKGNGCCHSLLQLLLGTRG